MAGKGRLGGRFVSIVAMAVVAVFATAPLAGAGGTNVIVTATVEPTFSLSVLTDGAVDFGQRALGGIYTAPEQQRLRVISSSPWDFTDSSDTRIIVGAVDVPRDRVIRHTVTPGFGTGLAPGLYEITCSYVVDLTTAEAVRLPTNTPITTHFGYSAVQR